MWLYAPNGQGQAEEIDQEPVPAPFDGNVELDMGGHWEQSRTLTGGPTWYDIGENYQATTYAVINCDNIVGTADKSALFHVRLGS
jgi:hypothetical protein